LASLSTESGCKTHVNIYGQFRSACFAAPNDQSAPDECPEVTDFSDKQNHNNIPE
jgi:hypothetical protein